jgi:hypothetical protein
MGSLIKWAIAHQVGDIVCPLRPQGRGTGAELGRVRLPGRDAAARTRRSRLYLPGGAGLPVEPLDRLAGAAVSGRLPALAEARDGPRL